MMTIKEIVLVAVLAVSYISAIVAIIVVDDYAEKHLAAHHSTSLETQP